MTELILESQGAGVKLPSPSKSWYCCWNFPVNCSNVYRLKLGPALLPRLGVYRWGGEGLKMLICGRRHCLCPNAHQGGEVCWTFILSPTPHWHSGGFCGPQGPDLHLSSSSKQTTLLKQGLDIPCMTVSSESTPVDHHVEFTLIWDSATLVLRAVKSGGMFPTVPCILGVCYRLNHVFQKFMWSPKPSGPQSVAFIWK